MNKDSIRKTAKEKLGLEFSDDEWTPEVRNRLKRHLHGINYDSGPELFMKFSKPAKDQENGS